MNKKLMRQILLSISLGLMIIMFPSSVKAAEWSGDCIDGTGENAVATLKGFGCLFNNVLEQVLRLVGIAAFVMLLVGGFKYLTAGGDPKNTEAAQKTLTLAISGLVLAIGAWFILNAISGFTGTPELLDFSFGI